MKNGIIAVVYIMASAWATFLLFLCSVNASGDNSAEKGFLALFTAIAFYMIGRDIYTMRKY